MRKALGEFGLHRVIHWLPKGASESEMVPNAERARDCAGLAHGKGRIGSLNPAATTAADEIFDVNKVRLAALVTSGKLGESRGVRHSNQHIRAANQTHGCPRRRLNHQVGGDCCWIPRFTVDLGGGLVAVLQARGSIVPGG